MKIPTMRQFLEAKRRLLELSVFDSIRHRLHAETLWHLNRRSFAGGLAAGLFAAFIPFPMQMLIAAFLAIAWQANMPVALVATWVSNPLTYAPIFYTNYKIGVLVLGWFHIYHEDIVDQNQSILNQLSDIGAPFLLGSVCLAVIASSLGYIFARLIWRLVAIRKRNRRRVKRRINLHRE